MKKIGKPIALACLVILVIIITNFTAIKNSVGIYHANVKEKLVALTYDDGPQPPYTGEILEILHHYQVKATFFCIGKKIAAHPELVKLVRNQGHELANHSYSHQYMVWRSPQFVRQEIETTDQLFHDLGIEEEIIFRPPFGQRYFVLPYTIYRMKKKLILWDVNSEDYRRENNPETIAQRVIAQTKPGSIILLHDGGGNRSRTVAATELILAGLQAKGYQFKTVSELINR